MTHWKWTEWEKKNKAQIKAVKRATSAEYLQQKTPIPVSQSNVNTEEQKNAMHDIYTNVFVQFRDKNLSSLSHAKYTCVRVYT